MPNKLTDKYWRGESTEHEEEQLFEEVEAGHLTHEHKELAEYLQYLKDERFKQVLEDDFDQRIMKLLKQRPVRSLINQTWIKVAAAIAFIASLNFGLYLLNTNPPATNKATQTETGLAFQEVQEALWLISSNLNKGMNQALLLGEFDRAKEELKTNKNNRKNESN